MILEAILLNFIDFFGKKFQDPIKKARNLVCSYQCAPLFHSSTSILTVSFWSSAPAQPSHSNSDRRTETDKSEAEASHLCPYKTPFAYRANLYPSLIGQKLITCSQVDDVTGEALICVGWIWLLCLHSEEQWAHGRNQISPAELRQLFLRHCLQFPQLWKVAVYGFGESTCCFALYFLPSYIMNCVSTRVIAVSHCV